MAYEHLVDDERYEFFRSLLEVIDSNIPEGFEKIEQYGGISYVVPLTLYPAGYHVTKNTPLPFLSVIAQKHSINVYHMGIYADELLLNWFVEQYKARVKTKLNMGKSCIRLKENATFPFELMGELVKKMSVDQWVTLYEKQLKKR